jgi:hypothetical protein
MLSRGALYRYHVHRYWKEVGIVPYDSDGHDVFWRPPDEEQGTIVSSSAIPVVEKKGFLRSIGEQAKSVKDSGFFQNAMRELGEVARNANYDAILGTDEVPKKRNSIKKRKKKR